MSTLEIAHFISKRRFGIGCINVRRQTTTDVTSANTVRQSVLATPSLYPIPGCQKKNQHAAIVMMKTDVENMKTICGASPHPCHRTMEETNDNLSCCEVSNTETHSAKGNIAHVSATPLGQTTTLHCHVCCVACWRTSTPHAKHLTEVCGKPMWRYCAIIGELTIESVIASDSEKSHIINPELFVVWRRDINCASHDCDRLCKYMLHNWPYLLVHHQLYDRHKNVDNTGKWWLARWQGKVSDPELHGAPLQPSRTYLNKSTFSKRLIQFKNELPCFTGWANSRKAIGRKCQHVAALLNKCTEFG